MRKLSSYLLIQVFLVLATYTANAQNIITGRVIDAKTGEPLIGASVIVKTDKQGVATDVDGNFSLTTKKEFPLTLQLNFIGYRSLDVDVYDNAEPIEIRLQENYRFTDEVVVIGYGKQKKGNVIGSVSSINADAIEGRAVANVSNILTGQLAGVNITQTSGNPGADAGTIRIRGVGSFGATPDPLILIDGLPGSLDDVAASEIESISVLKDASSAAIYGSRAANGVILVTTKNGHRGKTDITYNGLFGFSKALELPDLAHTWEFAEFMNYSIGAEAYTAAEIQKFKDGSDPYHYADESYLKDLIGGSAFQTKHEIGINGGNDKVRYLAALGYLRQNGLLDKNYYNRYNARLNVAADLTKKLALNLRLNGTVSDRHEPSTPGSMDATRASGIIAQAERYAGTTPSYAEDGLPGLGPKLMGSPIAWVDCKSFYEAKRSKFTGNADLAYTPIPGLTLKLIGGYSHTEQQTRHYRTDLLLTGNISTGPSKLDDNIYSTNYKTLQFTANYDFSIQKVHNFSILAGYTWEDESQRYISGSRTNFPSDEVPYLSAGGADGQTNAGDGYDWAIQSLFGRLTYNYKQRYLFETDIRYDGSSRFPTDSRYGLFPSVAVGWNISEETFWKNASFSSWLNRLKVKASWGELGNNNIGNYPYQSVYTLGAAQNYVFNGVYTQGAAITTYVDPTLKWERTRNIDFGLEAGLFNDRLILGATYFTRKTFDILYQPAASYSNIFGLNISQVNTGELENKGLEIEIGWTDQIGKIHYHVSGNLTVIDNKLTTLGVGNVTQKNGMVGNGDDLFIGYPIQMYYGYKTDGVFLTDDEIEQWVDQSNIAPRSQAGDIRYLDITNDGKVTADDKTYLGSRIPKYTFGLNLGAEYKNIDFSLLLQGIAKVKGVLTNGAGWAFYQDGNIQRWQMEGTWSVNKDNRYPAYPRLEQLTNAGSNNTLLSDFWTIDASYVKVRNVQLGYTLPKQIVNRVGIENLRVYLSAENPLVFKKFRKGWDPENALATALTTNNYYPTLSTYTIGISLKF